MFSLDENLLTCNDFTCVSRILQFLLVIPPYPPLSLWFYPTPYPSLYGFYPLSYPLSMFFTPSLPLSYFFTLSLSLYEVFPLPTLCIFLPTFPPLPYTLVASPLSPTDLKRHICLLPMYFHLVLLF